MKRSILINNISDWINDLDAPVTLTPMKALELQDLLVLCRRELSKSDPGTEQEKESETSRQVKAEIAKRMTKLGIKG